MMPAELSGHVLNLKNLDDFSGRYHKIETEGGSPGSGSRVSMKN
jgi:hypothetical protein